MQRFVTQAGQAGLARAGNRCHPGDDDTRPRVWTRSSALYDPVDEWLKGRCEGSGSKMKPYLDGAGFKASYIAATAAAYHGGQAATGRPERLFRDVSFFNSALQQRVKPATMSRAAMMRRNKIYRVDPGIIVGDYKDKHPKARKPGSGAKA